MENRPEFIDNRDGNTLARALADMLGESNIDGGPIAPAERPAELAIASAFFTPSGLTRLAPHLEGLQQVRLLFGVEAPRDADVRRPAVGEAPAHFERRLIGEALKESEAAATVARDRFPFTRHGIEALRRLIRRFRSQNITVRRYERAFLHAKAYIFKPPDGAASGGIIAGSSNLTGSGLAKNLELNLGRYDAATLARSCTWFERLWEEAEPVDLASFYEAVFAPYSPWEIFLRILYQFYGQEVAELAVEDKGLPLTSFQNHGVARALRLMHERGGVLVADEVGLGKTFIAGEIMRLYHRRRQRVLLICPAQLRDTTWAKFLDRWHFDFAAECVSFEELANDSQLRDPQSTRPSSDRLKRSIDEYQLIVVDEAHNYRNPDTPTRAAVLRRLLFGQPRDVLLLTATPVNNSLWDLFHLIRYFVRQDAFLAERGILSVYERFHEAMRVDPSNLSPDVLYPIIDATCVKRTRQFVKKHYAGDTIKGPDGRDQTIVFPRPRAITVRYPLTDPLPALFDEIEIALDPDGGHGAMSFARYATDRFLKGMHDDTDEEARTAATIGLIRSGLLKRFESSSFAFQKTLERLVQGHENFLRALALGRVVNSRFLREIGADDEASFEELLADGEMGSAADLYETEALNAAVTRDLALLQDLASRVRHIRPENDPKLAVLVAELEKIAGEAAAEASDPADETQRRKVLLFSFFADTVEYVRAFLREEIERNARLARYRGRIAAVTGGDDQEVSRQEAIYGFAPISSEAPQAKRGDCFDLLISTDVLAEGVNLQQCRHIINLDVPWNPMRLVQRHGRIDRIGSPHSRVFLRTIFPSDRLDQLLNLEQRILAKIAMAAASVGVMSPVAGAAQGSQVFAETREEIERLLREDPTLYERGGSASAAQTGEEYRQTLRKALAGHPERIVDMPWKAGSGMAKGNDRGVVFCATVGGRSYLRFVRAREDWSPQSDKGSIVGEIGTCLRLSECEEHTPRLVAKELEDGRIFDLWDVAQQDIWHAWMFETDPANLQPRLRPLSRQVAEFIRANMPEGDDAKNVTRALDIVESPWPRREEMMLREWFSDQSREGTDKSRYLAGKVLETGLEPFQEPATLPPIGQEEIELVCWLALSPDTPSQTATPQERSGSL